MLPWFAFGHISPFVQLSNKLTAHGGVRISFLSATGNIRRTNAMLKLTSTTQIIPLTLPAVHGLPLEVENTADGTAEHAELLKVALDLAKELGIKSIYFCVYAAISAAFLILPARLPCDKSSNPPTSEELKFPPTGFPETSFTSLSTFEGLDLQYVFTSFDGTPSAYDRSIASMKNSSAIIFKSCNEFEKPYVDCIRSQYNNKPILLAGPLVPDERSGTLDPKWSNWLDQFPSKSVIYCSFGSETFLTTKQIRELALGLELTGLPFFLVINFTGSLDSSDELEKALPENFISRVKGKGVVHSGWVQQQHILAHNSVGCYLCHAGLSSVMEALVNDCRVAMLPIKGDQFLNSKLVSLDLMAGVEVNRRDSDGYFGKNDICKAVKTVMVDVESEHVAMFPWFAFGHISPFVQLSNKLAAHGGVRISFLSAAGNVRHTTTMLNQTSTTQIIPLTLPGVNGLPTEVESTADGTLEHAELLKVAMDLMQPQIKTLLSELKPHVIVFDFAQGWIPELAEKLGIKSIYFSVFAAITSAFAIVPARLPSGESTNPPTSEQIKFPPIGFPKTSFTSLSTFVGLDLQYMFMSFNGTPSAYDRVIAAMKNCSAILSKSCNELEKPYIEYVRSQYNNKPILLAGPVIPEPRSGTLDPKWSNWLDQFPCKSVIYCSFGSETFLTNEQIKELALGLELSGLPFFLVINFTGGLNSSGGMEKVLPENFISRVKGKGVVHSGWVQQQHILAHDSVGCFLSHAGLSSVTEALVNNCQVVLLPLKTDQYLNSKLVSLDLKAGVEVNRRDSDGYFGKHDIYQAVKTVMVDVKIEPVVNTSHICHCCRTTRSVHMHFDEIESSKLKP